MSSPTLLGHLPLVGPLVAESEDSFDGVCEPPSSQLPYPLELL